MGSYGTFDYGQNIGRAFGDMVDQNIARDEKLRAEKRQERMLLEKEQRDNNQDDRKAAAIKRTNDAKRIFDFNKSLGDKGLPPIPVGQQDKALDYYGAQIARTMSTNFCSM